MLDDEGIELHPMSINAMIRENLIVYERSSEQQYRFGMPGGNITEDEIQSCIGRLQALDPPPKYLVLSGSLPVGVNDDLYARVAQAMAPSCRVVLDTSRTPLELGLQAPIYLIKPNMRELGQLVGQPVEDDSKIREVARSLIKEGKVQIIITSLGSGGAVLTTADEHRHIRAPTVKIRSKVGAGDSMVGGMVFALAQGKAILEAVRYGVAAGAAAVMTEGTELCRQADTERLYWAMKELES